MSRYMPSTCVTGSFQSFSPFATVLAKFSLEIQQWATIGMRPTLILLRHIKGHSHTEFSDSLRQNGTKLQTHPPSTLNVKIPNLLKIDVYNIKHNISVGNVIKLFFLSQKCINDK